jgi:type III pantothenate kinase
LQHFNLVIDCGNTFIKAATFDGNAMKEKFVFTNAEELKFFLADKFFKHVLVSSVAVSAEELLKWATAEKKWQLNASLSLPIKILYKTPATLGVDRIAAVCGAIDIFPNKNCLVIDAGSAITYDFIDDKKNYWGGAISPGISMRFNALHTLTERLPLVSATENFTLIGDSTETCIQSGVLNGVLEEMKGCIENYRKLYPDLGVVLTGGDTLFFENKMKQPIFAARDLVLSGLNRILKHHAAF